MAEQAGWVMCTPNKANLPMCRRCPLPINKALCHHL